MVDLISATSSSGSRPPAGPRWATPRSPDRPTFGPEVAFVLDLVGPGSMPWQRQVLDVACELLPDGRPAYRQVIVTVPRQSAKTTMALAVAIHRGVVHAARVEEPQHVVYSAQSGHAARIKLMRDFLPAIEASPFSIAIDRIYRSSGLEMVQWTTGSRLTPSSNSPSAGHGLTIHVAILDEMFEDTDNRREQSLTPAQITIDDAQAWLMSTMGDDRSVVWASKVDMGRATVEAGVREGIAYFDWSAGPEDDPEDPETWWGCMPALGISQSVEAVRSALLTMPRGEFERAFLNRPTRTIVEVIPWEAWMAVQDDRAAPAGGLTLGIDVNPERTGAAVVAADAEGRVEVIEAHEGVAWLIERTLALAERHDVINVVAEGGGPVGSMLFLLEQAGVSLRVLNGVDYARACGSFFDDVMHGTVTVRPNEKLSDAVAGARKRNRGDAFVWARRAPAGAASSDLSPLVATTIATYVARSETASPGVF